jgi:hypothetical protein
LDFLRAALSACNSSRRRCACRSRRCCRNRPAGVGAIQAGAAAAGAAATKAASNRSARRASVGALTSLCREALAATGVPSRAPRRAGVKPSATAARSTRALQM